MIFFLLLILIDTRLKTNIMKKQIFCNIQKKRSPFLLGLIIQSFFVTPVWSEQQETEVLDAMVITGTHISNIPAGTTPVVTLDREYIDRSGATTVNDLFRNSILNSSGTIDEQFNTGLTPASASINLRGLGASRTLVLLDGRRMPIFPFAQSRLDRNDQSSFVDINIIPLSAIERIEILKDGASAIYGADAIAGVVNIITYKDYDGAKLAGQFGATLKVDGEEGQAKILAGKSWENTNITLAFDYFNRSEIKASDRSISESALGPIDNRSLGGNPGSIVDFSTGTISADQRCPTNQIITNKDGSFCSYDFAPDNTLISEAERTGFSGSLEHQFTENFSFFARGMYSHTESERSVAPAGGFLITNDPNSGDPVGVIYRFNELGSRIDEFKTDSFNFVGGFSGNIAEWDWELAGGMGLVETQVKGIGGYGSKKALQLAVDNGDLNPFGSSPSFDSSSVSITPKRKGESKIYFVDFKTNGTLIDHSYGTLKMAVGSEFRREKFSDIIDDFTASGDVTGMGGISGRGSRQIGAAYFEFYATAFDQLDMQFAGRVDHYSDFGTTFNPKFSLRWQPFEVLSLRGNVGTGFKPPALHELYTGEINTLEEVFDPERNEKVEVDLISKGNTDLDAEESFSYGFGFSLDATEWWQLSLDYWNIRNENAVVSNPQYYVDNESQFPNNVERKDGLPDGKILSVVSPFDNIAAQKMWGLDLNSSMDWEWMPLGYFRLDASGSYLGSFTEQIAPGASFTEYAGKDGTPHWRAQGSLTWTKSDYEISLTTNFVDGYKRRTQDDNGDKFEDDVGSWTTIDLQAVWRPTMLQGTTVSVGSINVFDTAPPKDPYFENWPFYNRALASPRGRFVYMQAQYEF